MSSGTITARAQTITNQFAAYGQVEPVSALPVQAVETGVIEGLEVLPGETVRTGQKLGSLGGPEVELALVQARAAVDTAQARVAAAKQALAVARKQLPTHLSTEQQVYQGKSAVAAATGALQSAQAQLKAVQQTAVLLAPANGIVLTVNAANGERVKSGQTILILQAADRLWLRAAFYGSAAAAIRPGMSGEFAPANGGPAIPVKVATVFGALAPDGGEGVGLLADVPAPGWVNGQFGAVTLNGPRQSLVAIPTRALILDRGKWWVLVHSKAGEHPQEVVPGPTRGWETFIERGLAPGAQVVVQNAYLEFHRNIARSFHSGD